LIEALWERSLFVSNFIFIIHQRNVVSVPISNENGFHNAVVAGW
jgi:hypothetical protein